MNYLAHMFLSFNPDHMMGNFLGDMLRNRQLRLLPSSVQRGVDLHRFIDHYTDNHQEVRAATRLIRSSQGKYAPVVTDVYFDYILAKNWNLYTTEPIESFMDRIYETVLDHIDIIPDKLVKEKVLKMIEMRFLSNYVTLEGIHLTFLRISKRTTFEDNLSNATQDLEQYMELIDCSFRNFFPDLIKEAKRFN